MNELSKFLKFMYEELLLLHLRLVFLNQDLFFFSLSFVSLSHSLSLFIAKVYLIKQIPVVQFCTQKIFTVQMIALYDPSNLLSIIPKTRLCSGANSVCYLSLRSSLSLSLSLSLSSSLSSLMGGSVCVCALEQALYSLSSWTIFF